MIDLAAEKLLTFEQVSELLLVSKCTVYRWVTSGSKGVKLEAAMVGGRWRTSEEAVQRFSDRLTPAEVQPPDSKPPIQTSKQRQQHQEAIDRELDEFMGVKRCETCRAEINAGKCFIPKGERLWCPKCLVQRKSVPLGLRIRTFRWAARISQQELGNRTGISADNIRAYECNQKQPSEAHVCKLMETLGSELVSGLKECGPAAV